MVCISERLRQRSRRRPYSRGRTFRRNQKMARRLLRRTSSCFYSKVSTRRHSVEEYVYNEIIKLPTERPPPIRRSPITSRKTIILKQNPQSIGGAIGKNPLALIIPCHRIVGEKGFFNGYTGGSKIRSSCFNGRSRSFKLLYS